MAKTFTNFCIGTYALALSFLMPIASVLDSTREKNPQSKPVKFTIPTHFLSPCVLVTCGKLLESSAMTLNTSHSGVSLRILLA